LVQKDVQRDEVAEGIQNTLQKIKESRNLLITIIIVAIVGTLLFLGVRGHNENVLNETNNLMSDALDKYADLERATDEKQRKDDLTAIVTATDNLIESHGGGKLAHEALYVRGSAYYSMDKFTEARKAYQDYIDQAKTGDEKARGEIALAYTYENEYFLDKTKTKRNNIDNALTHYGYAAIAAKGEGAAPAWPYLYYYALLGQARINELTGKDAEAIKLYQQIIKDRPAPIDTSKDEKETAAEGEGMIKMLRQYIATMESPLSIQTTAKLRLERLQATAIMPSVPATTVTVTPKTGKKPAAK
jgi:tetratricopeptide (TPR) repeat protein